MNRGLNLVCFQVHTMRSVDNLFLVSAMVTNFDFSPQTEKVSNYFLLQQQHHIKFVWW